MGGGRKLKNPRKTLTENGIKGDKMSPMCHSMDIVR